MTRALLSVLIVSLLVSWAVSSEAEACVHAQQTASAKVTQAGQRILVLYDGKEQTTVLRVEVETSEGLSDLALVVPVPAIPTRYATADRGLFQALEEWAPLHRDPLRAARAAESKGDKAIAAAVEPPLELLDPVEAGPFEIQPIKARGSAGATALNAWLGEHGYGQIPEAALGYYTDNDYAYLAVRAVPEEGSKLEAGALPPLSLTFPSEHVVVPLRLEAQGVFPVRIYLVTRDAIDDGAFAGARAKGFEVAATPAGRAHLTAEGAPAGTLRTDVGRFEASAAPAPVAALLKDASMDEGRLEARVLFADAFGAGVAKPSTWADELIIGGPPAADGDEGTEAEPDASANEAGDAKTDDARADDARADDDKTGADKTGADEDNLPIKAPDPKATAPKQLPKKGCSCTTTTTPPWSLLLVLLLWRRRD